MNTVRKLPRRVAGARLLLVVAAIYLAVANFPSPRSFAQLIGGVCLAYLVAALGALVERTRAAARAAETNGALTDEELVAMADEAFRDYCDDRNDDFDIAYGRAVERATLARKAEK